MAQRKTFAFSDEGIASLPTPKDRVEYADALCKGLRLRVGRGGTRQFVYYGRDAAGKRTRESIGHWSKQGLGGTFTVEAARQRYLDLRGSKSGVPSATCTVGDLLDLYAKREQVSAYSLKILKKHTEPVKGTIATALAPADLPDLVAKVMKGYPDERGRVVGGRAVADKLRSGLVSLFEWAQRQGRFPQDRALPTLGLARDDFAGIGWQASERVPSEAELHRLFDALGIGAGEDLTIDLKQTARVPVVTRLAVLLLMHVPVRSGVGVLTQPADAADLETGVLRWTTRKGGREEELDIPLSDVAVAIIKELRQEPGGDKWLVPSPENPKKHIDVKVLARMFSRLQTPSRESPARVEPDKGQEPFTPHSLRALWTTLAGDLGIHDGVAVRVIGHKPEGASAAHGFYDMSERTDARRDAVERVSADLERIRRRQPRSKVRVVSLRPAT